MRAILIDPFTETVTDVEYNGDYKDIYRLLSHETVPVGCFTVVQIDDANSIFVDDEGLLKDPSHFFKYEDYHQPLAGKGLILGCDSEGDSIEPTVTADYIREKVRFCNNLRLDHMEQYEGIIDHPVLGRTPMVGSRPVFTENDE